MSVVAATRSPGMPRTLLLPMTPSETLRRSLWNGGVVALFLVALLPVHAWSSIYECRDQDGHRIITDSPSQLEECKTISATPSGSKKGSFGGGQSYGDTSPLVTQSSPGGSPPVQYPPVLITGPNGELISEPDPSAGQTTGAPPPQRQDGAQAPPVVNQLHPFMPPTPGAQGGTEQKP